MPVDHKRINPPENTVSYKLFSQLNTRSYKERVEKAISPQGLRLDKRKPSEHRKIFLKTGVVSQAKGSAYIEIGRTKAIVSVFDPREIPNKTDYSQKGALYCEFKYATFSCPSRRLHTQDPEEKQNSFILKQALEPSVCLHEFPNFQVDIYALILENDGSAISAAITAASVALSHASIPLFDLLNSITLGVLNGQILVDPSLEEETLCEISSGTEHGVIVLGVLQAHQQISQFYQRGNVGVANVAKVVEMVGPGGCLSDVRGLVEKCVVTHVLKVANKDNEV